MPLCQLIFTLRAQHTRLRGRVRAVVATPGFCVHAVQHSWSDLVCNEVLISFKSGGQSHEGRS